MSRLKYFAIFITVNVIYSLLIGVLCVIVKVTM